MSVSYDLVLLHGKPKPEKMAMPGFDPSRANFLGWLADMERAKAKSVISLRPGNPTVPDYHIWKRELNSVALGMNENTSVVTHSLGAGAVLRWLSERTESGLELAKLVMVAPWFGRRPQDGSFCGFNINPAVQKMVKDLWIVNSADDVGGGVPETIEEIMRELPKTEILQLDGFGHFITGNRMPADYDTGDGFMGSSFPQIEKILEIA